MDVSYGRKLKDPESAALIRYTKLVLEAEQLEKLGGNAMSVKPNSVYKKPKEVVSE